MVAEEIHLTPLKVQHSISKEYKGGHGGPYNATPGNGTLTEQAYIRTAGLTKVNIIITELLGEAGQYRIRGCDENVETLNASPSIATNHRTAIVKSATALVVNDGVNIEVDEPHTFLIIETSKTSANATPDHVEFDVTGES